MNKTVIGGIIGVIALGAIAIFVINLQEKSETEVAGPDTQNSVSRPAVQAIPNTFSIMSPEEKAAAEAAAELEAQRIAQAELASSTSTTSDDTQEETPE